MLIVRRSFCRSPNSQIFVLIAITVLSCSNLVSALDDSADSHYIEAEPCDYYDQLEFNSSSANQSVAWQVSLGPRIPGSQASDRLRESVKENLTEWTFSEESHDRENFTLTNLIASYEPVNSSGQEIYLVAHYDTRDRAERDSNESLRDIPIDGANDGASGVAVLIELGKIIPSLNLNYTVKMLFTDGEDQGERPGIYGSKAWAENRSDEQLSNISAFIVIDMIGDADLHFTHVWPGSSELWLTIEPLAHALGLVEGENDCMGLDGEDVFDINTSYGVIDDHVAAHERGVPAIDIIDISYGEGSENWEGHWHTHDDTIDKVSAESLGKIGHLIELGLRSSSWLLHVNETVEVNSTHEEFNNENINSDNHIKIKVEKSKFIGSALLVIILFMFMMVFILDYRIKRL
jgi:glutaminyl-peptide cyclotransferase